MNDWRQQAMCLDKDPDLFFPKSNDVEGRNAAIAVCNPCLAAQRDEWNSRSELKRARKLEAEAARA